MSYAHASRWVDDQERERTDIPVRLLAVFAVLHVPFGFLIAGNPLLSALHAVVVLGLGMLWALDIERPQRVACVAAYITGADVLWRMTNAHVFGIFHQFGKYAIVVIFLLWMLRAFRFGRNVGPLVYLALLLPSIAAAAEIANFAYIRGRLSFNLSGPLALSVAVIFFRQVKLSRSDVARIMLCCVATVAAVYGVTLHSTLTSGSIEFTTESNFVTSGGYGPNQVSAMLGLGLLLLLFVPVVRQVGALGAFACMAGILAFGVQSALTFSRSGLYSVVGALLAAFPFFIGVPALRRRALPVAILVAVVVFGVVFPSLQEFTGGKFKERITDTHMSGREDLMLRDLHLWEQNTMLGVGPGMSGMNRVEQFKSTISHTEMTRLVAEHGMLGAFAALVLLVMGINSLRDAPKGVPRVLAACFVTWSVLFMVHAAMRLVAPAFFFGLAACMANSTDESWSSDEAGEFQLR